VAGEWTVLFDGRDDSKWKALRGTAELDDGRLVLDGRAKDAIVVAPELKLRDGELELEVLRTPGDGNAGPFTVSLRLPLGWNWQAVYFVWRPASLEVCRGMSILQKPRPEQRLQLKPRPRKQTWRFVLVGGRITVWRDGKRLLAYADEDPRKGTIALTASKCRMELLAARYRPIRRP
jgi:hypothetical protein